MVVEINQKYDEKLRQIASATGRTVAEVVEAAVERAVLEQSLPPERETMTEEEHAAMMARIDEIRSLAKSEIADDGFDVRDHDKVIYRKDW